MFTISEKEDGSVEIIDHFGNSILSSGEYCAEKLTELIAKANYQYDASIGNIVRLNTRGFIPCMSRRVVTAKRRKPRWKKLEP